MSQLPSTIKHPDTFLTSPSSGFDGVFDWSFTAGCFGKGKITPMDFDGVIERKGNFLVFETKGVGVPVPQGQIYTYQSLYKLNIATIVFIEGKLSIEFAKVWCQPGFKKGKVMTSHIASNNQRMAVFCNDWFQFSELNPVNYSVSKTREILAKTRANNALLLREYLIEKSGRFLDDGHDLNTSNKLASKIASEKFGVDAEFCLRVLKGGKK